MAFERRGIQISKSEVGWALSKRFPTEVAAGQVARGDRVVDAVEELRKAAPALLA